MVRARVKLPRLNVAEEAFLFQWRLYGERLGQGMPQRNFRFHPTRKWEIDFAFPVFRIGLEIQGGIWIRGAHARPVNIERDMEKHNALLDLGWRVWHFTPKQVKAGIACRHFERVLLSVRRGEECVIPTNTAGPIVSAKPTEPPARSGDLWPGLSSSRPPF